jgi:hypothetical protein
MPTKVKGTNLNLTESNVEIKTVDVTETLTVGNTTVSDLKEIENNAVEQAVALAIALG